MYNIDISDVICHAIWMPFKYIRCLMIFDDFCLLFTWWFSNCIMFVDPFMLQAWWCPVFYFSFREIISLLLQVYILLCLRKYTYSILWTFNYPKTVLLSPEMFRWSKFHGIQSTFCLPLPFCRQKTQEDPQTIISNRNVFALSNRKKNSLRVHQLPIFVSGFANGQFIPWFMGFLNATGLFGLQYMKLICT